MTDLEFAVGDEVSWASISESGKMVSMTKVVGFIHEIEDGKARCRRGKNGKVDHWVSLSRLKPPNGDPLRSTIDIIQLCAAKFVREYEINE